MRAAIHEGCPLRSSVRSAALVAHSPMLIPSQRSGSGSHRGSGAPPREANELAIAPDDEVGQGAAGQVGGAHAVADVAARQRCRSPARSRPRSAVTRNAHRAAQRWVMRASTRAGTARRASRAAS